MTFFQGMYMVSIAFHFFAFVIGLMTVGRFGYMFRASSPKTILHNPIEQKYWIIAFSSCGNLLVIVALYRYLDLIGFMPYEDEFLFGAYHIFSALLVVLWHSLTFCELKKKESEDVESVASKSA